MKLSISNIAWKEEEEEEISSLMQEMKIKGVEITPVKFFHENIENILKYRRFWNKKGIEIVAMQALLYGHPELKIFEDEKTRENMLEHLKKCVDIGALVGARSLVFGSPKNRFIPDHVMKDHSEIATDFFDRIGTYAYRKKLIFCLEPNPEEYGTNFICTTNEAIRFVRMLDNKGIKINLDTGSMIMNNEDHKKILEEVLQFTGHIHMSEPFLDPIDPDRVVHIEISDMLKAANYSGNVSIEMKKVSEISNIGNIRDVLTYVKKIYS